MLEGRTAEGKFAPGSKGGPGNPFASSVIEYRRAITEAVSVDDVRAIIKAMVAKAKNGDERAAKVVLERVAGKVLQEITISGPIKLYDIGKDVEEAV